MKILIVDDSSFIILVCRQSLEKSGFEVVGEAYDGFEAVEKALKLKPDMVIMDIALPGKNGFEATQLIQETLPQVKVLAISAIDEEWVRNKAIQSGCFDFLPKPFESIELVSRVKSVQKQVEGLKYG